MLGCAMSEQIAESNESGFLITQGAQYALGANLCHHISIDLLNWGSQYFEDCALCTAQLSGLSSRRPATGNAPGNSVAVPNRTSSSDLGPSSLFFCANVDITTMSISRAVGLLISSMAPLALSTLLPLTYRLNNWRNETGNNAIRH